MHLFLLFNGQRVYEEGYNRVKGADAEKIEKVIFVDIKKFTMGLLTPKGKKGDKKSSPSVQKPASAASKFISKSTKAAGGMKKGMTGGSQRGS